MTVFEFDRRSVGVGGLVMGALALIPLGSAAQMRMTAPDARTQRPQPIVRTLHFDPPAARRLPNGQSFFHNRPGFVGTGYFSGGYCRPYYGYSTPYYAPSYYAGVGYGYGGYGGYAYGGYVDTSGYGGVQLGYQQPASYSAVPQIYAPNVTYNFNATNPSSAYSEDRSAYQRPSGGSARVNVETPKGGSDSGDDYYLNRAAHLPAPLRNDAKLAQAVADIEKAFRAGDFALLQKHVASGDSITIQSKGRERHTISATVYLDTTREAMKAMDTVRYTLDHVEPASNGAWLVYGTHILRTDEGNEKSYNVGFVLTKKDDNWFITEVAADPTK